MVRIKRSDTGIIEVVPLEEYIAGVLAGEMPVSFHEEALKAQAVASRSYVMFQIIKNQKKEYDVVDTVLNQVYLDSDTLKEKWKNHYEEYYQKITNAVKDTAYQYLVYQDKVAEALFFSTSTGYTENSEEVFANKVPYLRSVESSWDKISPAFQEVDTYTKKEFLDALKLPNTNEISISILSKTGAGRINSIQINDSTFSGADVMSKLHLRSRAFTITVGEENVTIQTKGYGHGVGMSQYGAEGMAQAGYPYDEILKHYYTDIEIKKIKT